MSLFKRLSDMIVADVTGVLEGMEKKNPIGMLNHYLRQCEREVNHVEQFVERQRTLRDKFAAELKAAEEMLTKRTHQEAVAAQAGEEELLQFIRRELEEYRERVLKLAASLQDIEAELVKLEFKHEEMKQRLKDMEARRLELMAKENVARANAKAKTVLDPELDGRFKDVEQFFTKFEEAINDDFMKNTIDDRIAALEKKFKNDLQ